MTEYHIHQDKGQSKISPKYCEAITMNTMTDHLYRNIAIMVALLVKKSSILMYLIHNYFFDKLFLNSI